jgi:hypothetical protein
MSSPTRVSNRIVITPPLTWPEFKTSPLYNADYDVSEVKLRVVEETVDTDDGQVIRRTATGLVPSTEESFNFYNLVEHVQAAIDAFPGHEFSGRLDCDTETEGCGLWRVEVRGRKAVCVEPAIVWPDDISGLVEPLAETLDRARRASPGLTLDTDHERRFIATALAGTVRGILAPEAGQ